MASARVQPSPWSSTLQWPALTFDRGLMHINAQGDIVTPWQLHELSISGVGSVATRTLERKVKIHQHLLNQS